MTPGIRSPRAGGGALGCVALLILLAGCSPISTGMVTGKHSSPGYLSSTTTCHSSGKTTVCTPTTTWIPPTWRLDLRNADTTGWVYVSEHDFDAYRVGEVYP